LLCQPGYKIGLIGSLYFAGWSSTILWLPLLADKVGRKWIFLICVALTTIAYGILLLSKSLSLTIAMMFVAGACNSGRVMCGFIFCCEFLTP
jgi:MFS family permease